jgi:hypothetical protein
MPRTYRMSADTSEKEKVIGGILTAAQGGWLALGGGIIAIILVTLAQIIPAAVALVIALPPGLLVGLSFAFYKKEGLTLFQYITLNHKFKSKSKIMLNTLTYGKHFDEEVQDT